MSTPSGKPFQPVNFYDYAPRRVREQRIVKAVERELSEGADGGDDQGSEVSGEQSAAAARMPWERDRPADEPPRPDERPQLSPLVPRGPHERPDEDRSQHDGEDDHGPPSDRGASYESEPAEPDPPLAANDVDAADTYEEELDRLEASLKWLRRESNDLAGSRIPRAPTLPPVEGLRSPEDLDREVYIDGMRVPRSLKPSYVPPPMRESSGNQLGAVLRVAVACAIAAPIAYYFVIGNPFAPAPAERGAKIAAAEKTYSVASAGTATAVPRASQPAEALKPLPQPAPELQALQRTGQPQAAPQAVQPETPRAAPPVEADPWPAAAQGGEASQPSRAQMEEMLRRSARPVAAPLAAAPPAPAPKSVHPLDPEEAEILLKQGEQFIAAGDVATARSVFRRVAEAGSAAGALGMGATYDPAVLAKLAVRGITPDVEQARNWYQKAKELGSIEASARLERLASR